MIYGKFKKLYESPVSYDNDTDSKIGTKDSFTNTKWSKTPDKRLSPEEIQKWVYEAIENNVLSIKPIGSGVSKIVFSNDFKTVFKFTSNKEFIEIDGIKYKVLSCAHNQIAKEIKFYDKFKEEWSDILPKIYRSGDNWIIQEYLQSLNPVLFNAFTGIKYNDWINYVNRIKGAFKVKDDNVFTIDLIIRYLEKTEKISKEEILEEYNKFDGMHVFLEFCKYSNTNITEIVIKNLGYSNDGIKLLDFGV